MSAQFQQRWGGLPLAALRLLFVVAIWLPIPAAAVGATYLLRLADEIPHVPELDDLSPEYGSRVSTVDGWFLGGDRAEPVRYEDYPPLLIGAFLAAEDEDFFIHRAFSLRGILRATYENLRAGQTREGASTITQQVARQFLSRERTYRRKVKELLLARRLESHYSKERILRAYLDGVFLGRTAYGVAQASELYFQRTPSQLTVNQMATLAGILPAPSNYNPLDSPENARHERDRVLRRMGDLGMLQPAVVERELEAPLQLPERDRVEPRRMPRIVAAVRRVLQEKFGENSWGSGGFDVVVPYRPVQQELARSSLRDGVLALDRRQGWRGAMGRALDVEAVDEAIAAQAEGRFELARVVSAEPKAVALYTRTGEETLSLEYARWAEPTSTRRHYKDPVELQNLTQILAEDDLILVSRAEGEIHLEQLPAYEAALLAVDSKTGVPEASVGSFDADLSIFDRVFSACRQPGSVFKPVVYAQALQGGLTAATMLSDVPVELQTGHGGKVWRPRNADRDFKGYLTLADALAWSRNIPTVNLMEFLGARHVVARARKLGIESTLDTTSSVALGASCLSPVEVAEVFSAFQRRGRTVDIEAVGVLRDGDALVEDHLHFATPDFSSLRRLERMSRVAPVPPRGVSENVAYIMLELLRRVVTSGTASDLPDDWLVAGKTGTTNEFDGWFVGLDGELTTTVWVGSDKNERPLGRGEHGATVALPIFVAYYHPFARVAKDDDDRWPDDPPPGVGYEAIDPSTGLLAPEGEWGVRYPFTKGTAPTQHAPTRGTRQAQSVDELIYDF